MATSLAQQLKRLALPEAQAAAGVQTKQRKSLLFDPKEAAALDRETFYAVGINGLQELENIDPAFQEFENTLFDETSKAMERSVQTKEVNDRLDRKIGKFLLQLSPYFLLKPAQKALEWLIYRFNIHQYNIDDLLRCVIPYHDTNIFVRVVQLLDLSNKTNKWHWLQSLQTPGVPLAKSILITQCYKDPGFLQFVCNLVPSAIKAHKKASSDPSARGDAYSTDSEAPSKLEDALLRVVTCFYCSAIVGTIEVAKPITEKLLSDTLPFVLKGLKSRFVDYQAASYMIVCQLAIKIKMKLDLVDPIIRCICRNLSHPLAVEGLSCVAILCHTQPVTEFPEVAFQKLCTFSSTISAMEVLSQAPNATPLLRLFLTRLLHAAVYSVVVGDQTEGQEGEGEMYWTVLEGLLQRVKLDVALTNEVAKMLLQEYVGVRKELWKKTELVQNLKQKASPIVSALEKRYPEAMDLAIGSFMSQDISKKEQKLMQELISMSASAAKHKVISGTSTTLILSLNHASPDVRVLGIQHLKERVEAGDVLEEFCIESLMQRLHDDKIGVINQTLGIGEPLCKILPQEKLFDRLKEILLKRKMKSQKGIKNVQLSLKLMTNGDSWDEHRNLLIPLVVPYMFSRGEEMADADSKIMNIIKDSTLSKDYPIFRNIGNTYRLNEEPSKLPGALIEMMASNLVNMEQKERQKLIEVLVAHVQQPSPSQEAYRFVLDVLLLRTAHHLGDQAEKIEVALTLLKVLEKDVGKMLTPGFSIVEPKIPLPEMSDLPDGLNVHLVSLLTQRLKPKQDGDAPTMHQSHLTITLWCLGNLVVDVRMPQCLKTETKLWSASRPKFDPTSQYLAWLLRLLDVLTEAAVAKEKKVKQVQEFKGILSKVIEEHLNTPDILWNFLSLVWSSCSQTPSEQLYPVSAFYQARCLHIALTSAKEQSMTSDVAERLLGQSSEVLPTLLVVLSSEVQPIRVASARCLQALATSFKDEPYMPYIWLGQYLAERTDELSADPTYVKQALKLYFAHIDAGTTAEETQKTPSTPKKKKKAAKPPADSAHPKPECLRWLLEFVNGDNTPRFLQRALLEIMSEVKNKIVLSSLLGMLNDLLGRSQGQLSSDEVIIVEFIIQQFTPATAAILSDYFEALSSALSMEKSMQTGKKSPQKMVLKQITPLFFQEIPASDLKQALFSKLIDQQVETKEAAVAASIGRTLRKLPLEAEQIVLELDKLQTVGKAKNLRQAKKARMTKEPSVDDEKSSDAETRRWQRVTHIVELLQQQKLKKIKGVAQLVPALFTLLSRCLELDQAALENSMEYLKQLILTTLLNICNQLTPDSKTPAAADSALSQAQFSVEVVVQCIRTTDNPQTHRHALMLLAAAAGLFPEHVLHNIMAIFTFMGANMLHQDDSYSFQVIMRTVETVIPALIKASEQQTVTTDFKGGVEEVVVMVMRVFVDAYPHIPEHRRLPLFGQLMKTVGEEKYLSKMLALLIGGYVTKGAAAMHPGDEVDVKGPGRSIDFWLSLSQEFSPHVQITSLTRLLEYVSTLTEDKKLGQKSTTMATRRAGTKPKQLKEQTNQEPTFDADPHIRARQMRQFRFTAVCFMPHVVSSSDFIQKVADVSQNDSDKLKKLLQRLLEVLLGYITQVAQSVHKNAGKDTAKFWRALLHRSYDALDKVNALLPAKIFIDVIAHLLGNKLPTIRRKAMELLNNKLLHSKDYFNEKQNDGLLGLISGLLTIATATKEQPTDADEVDANRHTALYSLKLLCALLGDGRPVEFGPVLEASVTICHEERVNAQVQGSAMLCLAECVRNLRAHSIQCLPRFMPRLLDVLASKENIVSSDLHLMSAVTAVQKVIETLPHFQSPYLVDLLLQICRLSSNTEEEKSQLNLRLKALSHNLSSTVSVRVLLPTFSLAYERMVDTNPASIGPLMEFLSDHLGALDKTDMTAYQQQAITFFLAALDYRTKHADLSLPEVDAVEGHVIRAVLTLVMKLSEASFRPMLLKVVDWATRSTSPKDRLLTLYRLSDAIADKLKSLFTLFAGHLVAKAADLLDSNNTHKTDKPFFEESTDSDEKSSLLLVRILDCLHKCFMYDKGTFVSKERFQRLMQPLVDQIENMQGTDDAYRERVSQHLTPCIAQLLVSSRDSSTWQPLNYQVLLKTRHSSPKVRFAALTVLQELHKKLAEDYLSLLPETIPFLAELMEDESEEVEQHCQLVVNDLEKTLGEPLQKYF
ncbi:HEAT repeat-containing protein 1-like [Asterias amurensis]|uniref:HEAT repeat-containing protein 1-like n=1 Tax=Asterias amurensis TaxID=7602 RepID=UPI003AB8F4ED